MHPDHVCNHRRQNCTRAVLTIKYLTPKTISHKIQRSITTTTTLHGSRFGQSEIKLYFLRYRDRRITYDARQSENCLLYESSADNPKEFTTHLISLRTGSNDGCLWLYSAFNSPGFISTAINGFSFTRFCDEPSNIDSRRFRI